MTKFDYIISGLPKQVLERIPDMLNPPPATDGYNKIKQRVLSTYQQPFDERLAEFIEATTLGGLRPSAFADHISALTAGATLDNIL